MLLLILIIIFKNYNLLYSRNEYLPKEWSGNFILNILQYASFISILSLFLIHFQNKKSLTAIKWAILIAWQFLFLSLASRAAISIAILYLISRSLLGQSVKFREKILLSSYIFSIYSLALIIRGQESFGLKHIFETINSKDLFTLSSLEMVHENIVSPIGILGLTNQIAKTSYSYLLTAINPMPGRWTNWYEISPALRINSFIPYSGYGELSTLGPLGFVLIFAGIFWVIRFSINITKLDNQLTGILTIAVILIFSAFLFLMLQYNLRSSLRIFEAGVATTWIIFLIRKRFS